MLGSEKPKFQLISLWSNNLRKRRRKNSQRHRDKWTMVEPSTTDLPLELVPWPLWWPLSLYWSPSSSQTSGLQPPFYLDEDEYINFGHHNHLFYKIIRLLNFVVLQYLNNFQHIIILCNIMTAELFKIWMRPARPTLDPCSVSPQEKVDVQR